MSELYKYKKDLTFITNEPGETLRDRFFQLIKDTRFFDCLVAFFNISGFYTLYKSLEETEKIRILIGIGTSRETFDIIKSEFNEQNSVIFSNYEYKKLIEKEIEENLEESEDETKVEEGIKKFLEWIKTKKIEIRGYPNHNLHAKVYILTFKEEDRDVGRVITGSSNFTYSGLVDNLEFNVELKNYADYEFAKQKFEELWSQSVDLNETFINTITHKTWLNDYITPYELYLKFLYEYFKEEMTYREKMGEIYKPEKFLDLEYQKQAVINSKRILEEYGGVFLSDVVGTGKTYIAAMLANQLDGRTMVIAPPSLLNKVNPGSWPNVFLDFKVSADFFSIGKLDDALDALNSREYKNIIIDEAHRFRNETTISYEKVAEICKGKRVILVTATPYNNAPKDLLSMIKLFQNPRKSTIPGLTDLEAFFTKLDYRLRNINRQNDYNSYLQIVKENAKEIREKILKYLMVRRTRNEIEKYFKEDLERNNIKFPEVEKPIPFFYQLNDKENIIFMETIRLITQNFKYARYTPLLYLKRRITAFEEQSQRNMGGFMKVLLVKRLESSFYAFRETIKRFYESYEKFIDLYNEGYVYVSKAYINKIFELLEQGNDEEVQRIIDEGKAEKYSRDDFREDFIKDLKNDFNILKEIKKMWENIKRDPKLEKFLNELENNELLKDQKLVIFTESKETAEYLKKEIEKKFGNIILLFHGNSPEYIRDEVIENFDASAKVNKNNYRILVTTEVLSEGVNLHRSNIVINYDIPWNPTRLMQRVGRINRIGTKFNKIYTFNFFPTEQSENEIELINIARSKIEAFFTLLGGDAAILTEGEPITSHELFDKLLSKSSLIESDEDESELKYLKIIEDVRNNNPDLFEKIKQLPKKARSSKKYSDIYKNIIEPESLLTFFRKGKLMKFYVSDKNIESPKELDFITAAKLFECINNEIKKNLPLDIYYNLLNKNKNSFNLITQDITESYPKRGKDIYNDLLKIVKFSLKQGKNLTDSQENYFKKLIIVLENGAIPKRTVKRALEELEKNKNEICNCIKVYEILSRVIPKRFIDEIEKEKIKSIESKREVILSLYLTEED